MHSKEDLIGIRNEFAADLKRLRRPVPGPLWHFDQWTITMQTIIELEKMIGGNDSAAIEDNEGILSAADQASSSS